MNTFSATGAIRFGWETFKKRPAILIGAMVVVLLLQLGLQLVSLIPIAGAIASFVASIFIGMGIINFAIAAHDNIGGVKIDALWRPNPFWRYLFATLIKGLVVSLPLGVAILFWMGRFVAGTTIESLGSLTFGPLDIALAVITLAAVVWLAYISIRLLWVEYLILQKDIKALDAVKESFRITKGHWWNLAYLTLLVALINIVGAIALLVGLLVSVPVSMLAMVHVYKKLTGGNTVVSNAPVQPQPATPVM